MIKFCFRLTLVFLLSSCSLFKMASVHDEMKKQIDQRPYPLSLNQLKTKIVARFEKTDPFGGKMISGQLRYDTPKPETLQQVKELMEEGFTYKDQLYTSVVNIDFSFFTGDMEKIKNKIFKSPYHVLHSDDKSFLMVKGNQLYEGVVNPANTNESILKVFMITKAVVPMTVDIDWFNLIRGKGSFLGFSNNPVNLEASRKYEMRDTNEELALFFNIEPEKADALEKQLLSNLKD